MSQFIKLSQTAATTYATLASFPPNAAQGALAIDLSTDQLYAFETSDNTWHLMSGAGGGGTVTSVGVSAPAEITVTNSPVTTSGTIDLAWADQAANEVFAGPTLGLPGTPAFRALVEADLPAGISYHVETFTLTGTDITNGYVTLSASPSTANLTVLQVIGGPVQAYGDDFTVSGAQLSWSSLFLDGVLVAGDKLIVQFN